MVIPRLPNLFANAKVKPPKCLFLLQIHTHISFHLINRRSLLKELFILQHLIHCLHLNNQESTETPWLRMDQIVLYIGVIALYIRTLLLVLVADILHPHSTRDNLQLVPHLRRDIIYKTRPQLRLFACSPSDSTGNNNPSSAGTSHLTPNRYNEWSQTIWRSHSGWWCALWWWTTTVFSWCFIGASCRIEKWNIAC